MDKEKIIQEILLEDTYDVYEQLVTIVFPEILDRAYTLVLDKIIIKLRFSKDDEMGLAMPILDLNLGVEQSYAFWGVVKNEFLMLINKMRGLKCIDLVSEGYVLNFDRELVEDFINEEIQKVMYSDCLEL